MPIQFSARTGHFPATPPVSGWTDPVASGDTRTVYVASNGSNSNDGLTTGTPKQTIAAAKALLRPGYPDWLLLKRGQTFAGQDFGEWKDVNGVPLSGRSPTERMVIGTWSTGARPIVQTWTNTGLTLTRPAGIPVNYLYVLGISFTPDTANVNDPGHTANGIYGFPGSYIHIEDCKFSGCRNSILLSGNPNPMVNVVVRRNVIVDSLNTQNAGHAGISIVNANVVLVEQNVIDALQVASGGVGGGYTVGNVQPEGIRIATNCSAVTISENVVSNVGFAGISTKASATVKDNVVFQCPRGIAVGPHPYAWLPQEFVGPITASVTGNLVKDSVNDANVSADYPPVGYQITGVSNSTWSRNIWSASAVTGVLPFWVRGGIAGDVSSGPIDGLTLYANKIVGTYGTVFIESRQYQWHDINGLPPSDNGNDRVDHVLLNANDIQLTSSGTIVQFRNVSNGVYDHVASAGNRFWGNAADASHLWYYMLFRPNPSTLWYYTNGDLARWATLYHDTTSAETQVSYPGAAYTLGSYHASVGGTATTAALVIALRAQSRAAWNADLMAIPIRNYFRTGYTA